MFIGPLSIVALKYLFEGIAKAYTFKNWVKTAVDTNDLNKNAESIPKDEEV